MKLVGSTPSPYVRRLRLWLEGEDYEFMDLNIYSPQGREVLKTYTPAMKIPMLVDGEQKVFDSRMIYRYLNDKLRRKALSLEQENNITLTDSVLDAFIIILLSNRSGIDASQDAMIYNLQRERVALTLPVLEEKVKAGEFDEWQYPAICLFSTLDWITFRDLFDFGDYPALSAFREQHLSRTIAKKTDPRQSA
ncbi:glutathione S-transferase family protein [Oceanospirillum sediminis]|uniref:Glutathione S-transferase family protein n=1 Tax=Oceanospirillum sediminis TaxID=2760088 RepID=A0A839ISP8_9GAMM|nr:glutathione S-transferase family protein [Oceanospirillum sediminis]MBB1487602.1 glutathione S-transferase family protein [Oceanospirillum sediminis]